MCVTCGCEATSDAHGPGHDHDAHDHSHAADAVLPGARGFGVLRPTTTRTVSVEQDLLAKNDRYAATNRHRFEAVGVLALNLVSSPGSGKTTLLVETLKALAGLCPAAVVEGDQQTSLDADRIAATGAPVVQLNTGKGCHLDAHQVGHAAESLPLQRGGILFIENVGNLVCPAAFDLGEAHKVVVLSVTEGDDKPLKYPDMFRAADLCLITKSDLLPYVPFDVARATANAMRINPALECLTLSVMSGAGFDAWLAWLRREVAVRARMSGPLAVTDAGARA
ncbi:MAG: hydrogenase nickel incorporation protein HypB [Proteobacteria bacterium]|nr:hydrogenase nickel incorporation protein HypB [Pseudomonadota bacterium]